MSDYSTPYQNADAGLATAVILVALDARPTITVSQATRAIRAYAPVLDGTWVRQHLDGLVANGHLAYIDGSGNNRRYRRLEGTR